MRLTALIAIATLLFAAPVSAQPSEPPERLFLAARRAFDQRNFEEALRLFRQAYEIAPHPAVRFNIARTLEQLGRPREAWEEARAAAESEELGAADRARAQSLATRMHDLLATLDVRGSPEGAEVRVDGVNRCNLPCTVEIDPGDHVISAYASGAHDERSVHADRSQRLSVELTVQPAEAHSAEPPREHPASPIHVHERPAPRPSPHGTSAGWLAIVGGVVMAAGIAGIIGFGLDAQSLYDQYRNDPTRETFDRGVLSRDLANASIGVAALGVVLVALDLVLGAAGSGSGLGASIDRPIRF